MVESSALMQTRYTLIRLYICTFSHNKAKFSQVIHNKSKHVSINSQSIYDISNNLSSYQNLKHKSDQSQTNTVYSSLGNTLFTLTQHWMQCHHVMAHSFIMPLQCLVIRGNRAVHCCPKISQVSLVKRSLFRQKHTNCSQPSSLCYQETL